MSGLGGGIAGQGEVCGALIGAIAGLGLALGTHLPSQERNPPMKELAERFWKDFLGAWGFIHCREVRPLLQAQPRVRPEAKECTPVVRYAAQRVAILLGEAPPCVCAAGEG